MKELSIKYIIGFIFVVAVLLALFHSIFQILTGKDKDFVEFFLFNMIPCLLIAVVDYLIVNAVYRRSDRRFNTYFRVIFDLLLTSLFPILLVVGGNLIFFQFFPLEDDREYEILKSVVFITLWNCFVVLFIEIFLYSRRQLEAQKQMAIFEKEKAQYQYKMLKAQINPHFLFNSLNVLSSLAYEDPDNTNLFAKKLSGIYRYVLFSHTRETVTIEEELAFLESYIFLEKIRFGEALRIDILKNTSLQNRIIPVSLQLLVENATKHNIASNEQPLHIVVEIGDHEITVTNNLQLRNSVSKNGYGLSLLNEQYKIYGLKTEVTQTENEFIVKIPLIFSK